MNFGEAVALRECLLFMMKSLFSDQVQAIKDKPQKQYSSPNQNTPTQNAPAPQAKPEASEAAPVDLDEIVF